MQAVSVPQEKGRKPEGGRRAQLKMEGAWKEAVCQVRGEKMERSDMYNKVNKEQQFTHFVNHDEFSGCCV